MFSVLVCSRKKDVPDSDLPRFLKWMVERSDDYKNFEVLVRFDSDDHDSLDLIKTFSSYPFRVDCIVDVRGRGTYDFNINQFQLTFLADDRSTFYVTMADDYEVELHWDTILLNAEKKASSDVFVIQWISNPPTDRPDYETKRFNLEKFDVTSENWLHSLEVAPAFSKKLLQITSGMGFIYCTDVWITILQAFLYQKYGKKIVVFTDKNYVTRLPSYKMPVMLQLLKEGEWSYIRKYITTKFFRTLVEQQAENIANYLK